MTQNKQAKNIFGFKCSDKNGCDLQKTACFFCPSDNGGENSFSTQMTDGRESSMPMTPEQNEQNKVKGKIYTFKCKVPFENRAHFDNRCYEVTEKDHLMYALEENLFHLVSPIAKINSQQNVPILRQPGHKSQREKRVSTAADQEVLDGNFEIKDFVLTESDLPNESCKAENQVQKNFTGENNSENSSSNITSKEAYMIKRPSKNRIQIGRFKSNKPLNSNGMDSDVVVPKTISLNNYQLPENKLIINNKAKLLQNNVNIDKNLMIKQPNNNECIDAKINRKQTELSRFENYVKFLNNVSNSQNPDSSHKKVPPLLIGNHEGKLKLKHPILFDKDCLEKKAPKIKLVKQINPSHANYIIKRPIMSAFAGVQPDPQKNENLLNEGSDARNGEQRRQRSKFKTQEAILSKLFSPTDRCKCQ